MLGAAAAMIALVVLHLVLGGSRWIPWQEVAHQLSIGDSGATPENLIVWRIRLPRAIGTLLIGMVLGACGGALQATTRNPLAEPYLVGVSGGASVAGTLAILFGLAAWSNGLGVVFAAVVGALGATLFVLSVAKSREQALLVGLVVGTLLSSATTVILLMAGKDTNHILMWLLGSTANLTWEKVAIIAIALVATLAGLGGLVRSIHAISVVGDAAENVGVDVFRIRNLTMLFTSIGTAVTVGSAGLIGFVGLVAPHLARRTLGNQSAKLIFGGALYGGIVLQLGDIVAQKLVPGMELPVGAVTAILGAPFLLALIPRGGLRIGPA